MFGTFESFARAATPYLALCSQFKKKHGLTGSVVLDHICFKCSSSFEFEHVRKIFECDPPSKYLHQVHLAGRRVAYIGLATGLTVNDGDTIMCVELADKKPIEEEKVGFHHVEMFPLGLSYETLVRNLRQSGEDVILKNRLHHTTHDIAHPTGFVFRLTDKPLIKKIVEEKLLK